MLDNKRLIFSINTGRSGTAFLTKMLSVVPGVACFHEPDPCFSLVMREVQTDPLLAKRFLLEQKIPFIQKCPAPIYLETSHLFGKGFVEPMLALGMRFDLLLITRSARLVASSFLGLNSIPGRSYSENGLKYLLSPADPGVLPLPNWQALHDYQLCYWYCLEMRRRQRIYQQQVRDLGKLVVEISFNELTTLAGLDRILQELALPGLGWTGKVRNFFLVNQKVNKLDEQKKRQVSLAEQQFLEEDLFQRLADYPGLERLIADTR